MEEIAEVKRELAALKLHRAELESNTPTDDAKIASLSAEIIETIKLLNTLLIAQQGNCPTRLAYLFVDLILPQSHLQHRMPTELSVPADRAGRRVGFQHFREACMLVWSM